MPASQAVAPLRVVIVDCGSSKVPDIARLVGQFKDLPEVVLPQQLELALSTRPNAVILSGNPALIADTGTGFLKYFECLKHAEIPVLGICFGHQVIGLLYGATVHMDREDREIRTMQLHQPSELFHQTGANPQFRQDHTESVTLPDGFIHLASSSHCQNEAMKHPDKLVYGVQFHPECSGTPGQQLLENFLDRAR